MNWDETTLGQLAFFQRGFDITKAEQRPGDIPVVSSSGIKSYHSVAKVEGPGVVIGRKGSLGTVHWIESDYWPHDTTLWVKDFKGNNPKYVYYFLHTLSLASFDTGGANPTLNRNHIHTIRIRRPGREIQNRIADILSAYDHLIANNNRRISLLEEAIHRLYREWFVHLRFPGYEHTSVVDGVPEGWEKRPIKKLLAFHIGGGWGSEEPDASHTEPAFVIRGTDIEPVWQGDISTVPFRYHKENNLHSRKLFDGDIIFEVSGGSKTQGVGRTLLLNEQMLAQFSESIMCASFCKLLRPKERELAGYLALLLLVNRNMGGLTPYESQSASNIINFKFSMFLDKMLVLIPPGSILSQFDEIIEPVFEQITNLGIQNQYLRAARDALLPRLMNGSLTV